MMKRIMKWILCIFFGLSMPLLAAEQSWIILVYIAGDNDLYPYVAINMDQMMRIGSNDKLLILVYLCKHPAGQPKVAQKIIVRKNRLEIIDQQFDIDSGSYETFFDAMKWACSYRTSNRTRLGVIGWDHGSGVLNKRNMLLRGVCYDYTTGHYLTDLDVRDACARICRECLGGNKIDILGWDACLMASTEFHITLAPYVGYIVASEDSIPGTGWNYTRAFATVAEKNLDARSVAQAWVAAYRQTYASMGNTSYTLSATDSAVLSDLADEIDKLAVTLKVMLQTQINRSVKRIIARCIRPQVCTVFDERDYLDFSHFCTNLLREIDSAEIGVSSIERDHLVNQAKSSLNEIKQLIKRAVIANVAGPKFPHASGLTIYVPQKNMHHSYKQLEWSKQHPAWAQMLELYLAS